MNAFLTGTSDGFIYDYGGGLGSQTFTDLDTLISKINWKWMRTN